MKINRNKLVKYLEESGGSMRDLAKQLNWSLEKLISVLFENGALNEEDAREFVYFVGAKEAMKIINWRQMDVRKPSYGYIFGNQNADYCKAI